jgi:hypothetical protein
MTTAGLRALLMSGVALVAMLAMPATAVSEKCGQSNRALRVYYYPLSVETLVDITAQNIMETGDIYDLTKRAQIAKLNAALSSATTLANEPAFSDRRVRIKVVERTSKRVVALVDNEGVVWSCGPYRRLSPAAIASLRAFFENELE